MPRQLRIPTTDERANNLTCLALAYRVSLQNEVPQEWRDQAVKALRYTEPEVNESREG